MKEVKFHKQWRGHDPGVVVELTDERAAELIGEYCKPTEPEVIEKVVEKPVKRRGRPPKVVQEETE